MKMGSTNPVRDTVTTPANGEGPPAEKSGEREPLTVVSEGKEPQVGEERPPTEKIGEGEPLTVVSGGKEPQVKERPSTENVLIGGAEDVPPAVVDDREEPEGPVASGDEPVATGEGEKSLTERTAEGTTV